MENSSGGHRCELHERHTHEDSTEYTRYTLRLTKKGDDELAVWQAHGPGVCWERWEKFPAQKPEGLVPELYEALEETLRLLTTYDFGHPETETIYTTTRDKANAARQSTRGRREDAVRSSEEIESKKSGWKRRRLKPQPRSRLNSKINGQGGSCETKFVEKNPFRVCVLRGGGDCLACANLHHPGELQWY